MLSGALGTNRRRRRRVCGLRGCQAQTAATKSGRWSGCGRKPALLKQKGPPWQLQGSPPPCRALPPQTLRAHKPGRNLRDPWTPHTVPWVSQAAGQEARQVQAQPELSSTPLCPSARRLCPEAGSLRAHGPLKTGFLTCTGGTQGRPTAPSTWRRSSRSLAQLPAAFSGMAFPGSPGGL